MARDRLSLRSAAASIDSLALANDTGTDTTDLVTTDASLTGTVSNDGETEYLLVEFDHDGDGVIDGATLTEEDGSFSYKPYGLEAGQVTIQARVKDYDKYAAPVFSNWSPITFSLEEEADTSLRVGSILPANDTGNSNTDQASTDATVTGQLVGGSSVRRQLVWTFSDN